jgi:hypothetical protein
MRKLNNPKARINKLNWLLRRIACFARYQYAAWRSLVTPNNTDSHVHNALQNQFILVVEKDDIGPAVHERHKRFIATGGNSKLHKNDMKKLMQAVQSCVNFLVEG